MVKRERIRSCALSLLVSFDNPEDRYSLLIYDDGSHIKYKFDRGSSPMPASAADIYDRLETIGYHKIKSSCSFEELIHHPIDRGSYKFQKHETRDSIYIKDYSANYVGIKASASYKFRRNLVWNCRFSLENSMNTLDGNNFKVSIVDDDGYSVVSSESVMSYALFIMFRKEKFLKLCRYYVYSYIALKKLFDYFVGSGIKG